MKIFTTLILLIMTTLCWASEDMSFSYSFTPVKKEFNLELYELSKHFEEKNFSRLTAFPSGNIPLIHADEVMTSNSHPGTIFIKTHLVAPATHQNKIITANGFYLYHTANASMAFYDFSKAEVQALLEGMQPRPVSRNNFLNMFISTAAASDGVPCVQNSSSPLAQLEFVTDKLSYTFLYKKLGECGVAALKGMEGQIESTFNFFQTLKENPAKLWDDMKKSYESMKYFITNFTSELKSFFDSMSGMPLEQLLEIGCTMIGEAMPGLLTMATGVGAVAGTAKIMAVIIPKLQRIKNLATTFKKHRLPKNAAKEALSCAL